MNKDKLLQIISDKMADLKNTLTRNATGLSLEEYDELYSDIEELQFLLFEIIEN